MPVITINLDQRHLDELARIESEIRASDPITSSVSLRSALIRAAVDQYIITRSEKKETPANDHE